MAVRTTSQSILMVTTHNRVSTIRLRNTTESQEIRKRTDKGNTRYCRIASSNPGVLVGVWLGSIVHIGTTQEHYLITQASCTSPYYGSPAVPPWLQ